MELQQPLWLTYCYSQEFKLSGQLHALHWNSPLAEEPQVCWYMQQTCDVLWSPGFACQNHWVFPACKHCSRHLRLLGTTCLMLLQLLIKWNKCHHSPLKRSVPLFFQNMSAGCWQIPDVAALILSQRRPCWIAVKSHLQHLLSWHSLHSWQTFFLSQLHLGRWKRIPCVHVEVRNSGAEPAIHQGSRLVTHCMNCHHVIHRDISFKTGLLGKVLLKRATQLWKSLPSVGQQLAMFMTVYQNFYSSGMGCEEWRWAEFLGTLLKVQRLQLHLGQYCRWLTGSVCVRHIFRSLSDLSIRGNRLYLQL